MNSDLRITIGFCDHPKTKRLIRKCGDKAFRCLIRLFEHTARYKHDGVLSNMDCVDIAIASDWQGDENEWVNALCEIGFLDIVDDYFCVHDWSAHNPYACGADKRSEKARNAAKARYNKKKLTPARSSASSTFKQCSEQELAVLNSAWSYAPSPDPKRSSEDSKIVSNSKTL